MCRHRPQKAIPVGPAIRCRLRFAPGSSQGPESAQPNFAPRGAASDRSSPVRPSIGTLLRRSRARQFRPWRRAPNGWPHSDPQGSVAAAKQALRSELKIDAGKGVLLGFPVYELCEPLALRQKQRSVVTLDCLANSGGSIEDVIVLRRPGLPSPYAVEAANPEIAPAVLVNPFDAMAERAVLAITLSTAGVDSTQSRPGRGSRAVPCRGP